MINTFLRALQATYPAVSKLFTLTLCAFLAYGCGGSSPNGPDPISTGLGFEPMEVDPTQFANAERAACILNNDKLSVGAGIDAPGRVGIEVTPGPQPTGACQNNTEFRFGSGIYDITGVVANTNGMGWESAEQVFSGLHTRQYARAYVIESPCNGQRVLFMSTDTGMVFGSLRLAVLDAIANDADLNQHYNADNVMLSATHAHQGPGGYSHHDAFNLFHFGLDPTTRDTISAGMIAALRLAHANIEANTSTAPINMAIGELLNTNINRSLPAFNLNAESERNAFQNQRGEQIETDKRFVQLNLVRQNNSAVGVINWFGVHPTILGTDLDLVSSDHKGFASLEFERIMGTDYLQATGSDTFVAAFAQTDEGDASPNIFINERPFPDPTRGGGADAYESNAIAGTKQLARALSLYAQGAPLSGPVDYRFFHVQMDQVTITDQAVLDSLNHPASLDADPKRTCLAALGVSFGAGAEDGPAAGAEGVDCADDPDVIAAGQQDFMDGMGGSIPANIAATAVLCNHSANPALDLGCQAEKPVLVAVGPPFNFEASVLPFQLFRIGNLALLGLPWEVTTMSSRRIQQTMLDVLAPIGIDTVVIAGLSNDYVHYLTTREEYSSQQYEGASTTFGPWSLAAVQQESRRLAVAMRDGTIVTGPAYIDGTPLQQRDPYTPSDATEPGNSFGDLLVDVPSNANPGDTIFAEFQAGHPRNDLKVQASYVYVDRQANDGSWETILTDRAPELRFVWLPAMAQSEPRDPLVTGTSRARAVWEIPANQAAGTYRLRLEGTGHTSPAAPVPYAAESGNVVLGEPSSQCPS